MEKIKRVAMCGLLVFAAFLWLLLSAGETNAQCSDATLSGCYDITWTGECSTCTNPGPRAGIGQLTFNGFGSLSGFTWAKSTNGTIYHNLPATGTYTVNPNCTGSATISESGTGSEAKDLAFVVVIGVGLNIHGVQTDSGRVITFAARPCL